MAFYFKVKEVKQGNNVIVFDDNLKTVEDGETFQYLKYFAFNAIRKEKNNEINSKYITVENDNFEIYYQDNLFPLGCINMYFQVDLSYFFEGFEHDNTNGWYRLAKKGDYIEFDAENKPRLTVTGIYSNLNNSAKYAKFFGHYILQFSYLKDPGNSEDREAFTSFRVEWGIDNGVTEGTSLLNYWGNDYPTVTTFGIARGTYPFCIREDYVDKVTSLNTLIQTLNDTNSIGANTSVGTNLNKVFVPLTMHTTYANNTKQLNARTNLVNDFSEVPYYLEYARKQAFELDTDASKYQYDQYYFPNINREATYYPPMSGNSLANNYIGKFRNFFGGIESVDSIPTGDGPESQPGGGNGNFDNNSDEIKSPTIPTVGALDTGFVTSYKLGTNQMIDLRNVFWSKDFIENVYKLFNDPAQALVSMQITYAPIESGVSQKMIIGNYETDITALKVTKQYYEKDFGEINIKEYWGNFLDYSPNTQLSIYLPFIGIRGLDVNNFMDGNIGVKYYIDALTGTCVAHITTKKGNAKDGYINSIIASYNGNCNIQIPWTSSNFLETQLKLVETGASVAVGTYAGISGIAPVTLSEATGLASAAANSVIREHSHINQGGNMTSNTGVLGIKYPYLILTRPKQSLPKNYSKYNGYPSNITSKLDGLSGFTKVMDIHLDNITASATDGVVYPTKAELDELESLLKQGVII